MEESSPADERVAQEPTENTQSGTENIHVAAAEPQGADAAAEGVTAAAEEGAPAEVSAEPASSKPDSTRTSAAGAAPETPSDAAVYQAPDAPAAAADALGHPAAADSVEAPAAPETEESKHSSSSGASSGNSRNSSSGSSSEGSEAPKKPEQPSRKSDSGKAAAAAAHPAAPKAAAGALEDSQPEEKPAKGSSTARKETAAERLTTPTAMRMLKTLEQTQGGKSEWHIATGVPFMSKKLAPDEMAAMVDRLCTPKHAEDNMPPKPHAVKLVFEGTKEVLVPVKETSKDDNIAYMSQLYERCQETRAKTMHTLQEKWLQPLIKPKAAK